MLKNFTVPVAMIVSWALVTRERAMPAARGACKYRLHGSLGEAPDEKHVGKRPTADKYALDVVPGAVDCKAASALPCECSQKVNLRKTTLPLSRSHERKDG